MIMKLKQAFVLGVALALCAPLSAQRLPTAKPESLGLSSERLQRIGDTFQGYVDEGRIAGAVGMVIRHGKVAWVDEWGMRDLEAGDPVESTDIFSICSMTKPIVSVAVMMLYEEGHFFLTDPVPFFLEDVRPLRKKRKEAPPFPRAWKMVASHRRPEVLERLAARLNLVSI